MLWGEIEARVDTAQTGDSALAVKCPYMLSATESGTVSTTITNTSDEEASPAVTAGISRIGGEQRLTQTLTLSPHETHTLQWTVDSSDIVFGRLILVDIFQSRYSDLSSRQGACGILNLNLFKLNGISSFSLIFLTAILCTLLGAAV